MRLIRPLIFTAACVFAFAASAQWQWLDKDGRKVFSDRAPPTDIPEKNILTKPSASRRVSAQASVQAANPAMDSTAPAASRGVDKDLQEKKTRAEAEKEAKRKADEERNARVRADNCARAQQAKTAMDSGTRVSRVNEKGEREFLDDAARNSEVQRLQGIIDANCR